MVDLRDGESVEETQAGAPHTVTLSASDHAALTQMARDSGMTQAQVVSRLIGMVGAVRGLERVQPDWHNGRIAYTKDGEYVRASDVAELCK